MREMPTVEEIQDAAEEVERCLWRAQDNEKKADEWIGEAEGEITFLVNGLDEQDRLRIFDQIIDLQERHGLPGEMISELFHTPGLHVREVDLAAFRLTRDTPTTRSSSPGRRM